VFGSLSSSKKGWHIASIAERRWVGVYSKRDEMRSIASFEALRKTFWTPVRISRASVSIVEQYLVKGMRFDLWKLVFHIVGVHRPNLFTCRSAQDLDDLHKLINARLSWEKRLSQHQLRHHAASGPDIYQMH